MSFKKHQNSSAKGVQPGVKGHSKGSSKSSKCPLCQALTKAQLHVVEEAWLSGRSAEAIAADRGLDEEMVDRHVRRCLMGRHRSRYARVARAFDMLWEAIDTAHETYLADPTMYNGTSYQGLVKQLRALMVDLENVQNADELVGDITQYALNPMIKSLTHSIISEAGSLKEDLTAKFDDSEAERLVGDFVRRLTQHFTRANQNAHTRIADVLAARDQNRLKASGGPGRPNKPKGKHANLRAVS